jgi:hypothetical protein
VREWISEARIAKAERLGAPRLTLLVTDRPESFAGMAGRFLGEHVPEVELVDLSPV